jgi:hypothetical protein
MNIIRKAYTTIVEIGAQPTQEAVQAAREAACLTRSSIARHINDILASMEKTGELTPAENEIRYMVINLRKQVLGTSVLLKLVEMGDKRPALADLAVDHPLVRELRTECYGPSVIDLSLDADDISRTARNNEEMIRLEIMEAIIFECGLADQEKRSPEVLLVDLSKKLEKIQGAVKGLEERLEDIRAAKDASSNTPRSWSDGIGEKAVAPSERLKIAG